MIGNPLGGWSDERIAALKEHYHAGMSASQSAAILGGITRNGVIGKRTRLNLLTRDLPSAPKARSLARKKAAYAPMQVAARKGPLRVAAPPRPFAKPVAVPHDAKGVLLLDLKPRMCRWPINEPPAGCAEHTLFCAAATEETRSYCPVHHLIAHPEPPKRVSNYNPDAGFARSRSRAA